MMALHPAILEVPAHVQAERGRPKVQALSRLARQAAQRSATLAAAKPLPSFPKDADGVPQPVAGLHWSLSHKSALVAGIVAPHPIGIDLELRRAVKSGMHARIATAAEWRLGQPDAPLDAPPCDPLFYRFWTAKEAVLKAVGQGLVGLSRCQVVALDAERQMRLTYDGDPWTVVQRWYGTHLVAVAVPAAAGKAPIRWPESARAGTDSPPDSPA